MDSRVKQFMRQSALAFVWLVVTQAFVIWMRPNVLQTPYEAYKLARSLNEHGDVEGARRAMALAVAEEPTNPGYQEFMGYLDLRTNRPREAATRFRAALVVKDERRQSSLGLAEALIRLGENDQAQRVLTRLSPEALTWEERRRLAQLMALTGSFAQALSIIKPLVHTRPHDADLVLETLALAAAAEDWEYVVPLPIQALSDAAGPGVLRGWMNRAIALRALGRKEEAYELLRQHPGPDTLEACAELALELEHFAEAADLYVQWIAKASSDEARTALKRDLAYALAKAGRTAAAKAIYRELIEADAARQEDRIRFAWLLNQQGHYEEAWKVLEPLRRPSDDPAILALQARTAFWAGKMAQAGDLLKRLLEGKRQ